MRLGLGMRLSGAVPARSGGWVDPLAGIAFALRLQTHRGDGVPLGLYQDLDELVPATEDGDPVAVWRDELSGSGLAATQSVSTKRPTLRFTGGIPWLEFDGVDDFLAGDLPGILNAPVGWATGVLMASDSQEDSGIMSISDDGMDWQSPAAFVFAQRFASTNSIRSRNTVDAFLNRAISPAQWFVDSGLAESTGAISFIDGEGRQEVSRSNPIASTRFMIGASMSWSFGSYNLKGRMVSAAFGPWDESQTLEVQNYDQTLLPP